MACLLRALHSSSFLHRSCTYCLSFLCGSSCTTSCCQPLALAMPVTIYQSAAEEIRGEGYYFFSQCCKERVCFTVCANWRRVLLRLHRTQELISSLRKVLPSTLSVSQFSQLQRKRAGETWVQHNQLKLCQRERKSVSVLNAIALIECIVKTLQQ